MQHQPTVLISGAGIAGPALASLQNPKVRELLRGQGLEIIGNTPDAFRKEIDDEIELWGKVIRDAGIKSE